MEGKQLFLFPNFEYQSDNNYHKKAKLGRYEKIQYELNNNDLHIFLMLPFVFHNSLLQMLV
ncbi:hypothetical protein [Dapis sp. BLCC M126]|uniref:hypothetical protein n=1 Tax=Dapis sp. BLCC M126 TaxID=3400189 RepID=UPI003CF47809